MALLALCEPDGQHQLQPWRPSRGGASASRWSAAETSRNAQRVEQPSQGISRDPRTRDHDRIGRGSSSVPGQESFRFTQNTKQDHSRGGDYRGATRPLQHGHEQRFPLQDDGISGSGMRSANLRPLRDLSMDLSSPSRGENTPGRRCVCITSSEQ